MRPREPGQRKAPQVPTRSLLEAVMALCDDAVIVHDRVGAIVAWNPATERVFGYQPTEIASRSVFSLFPDHVRDDVRSVVESVAVGDPPARFETEGLRKDGMPMTVSISTSSIPTGAEHTGAWVLVARDTTERRLAQVALAAAEARLRDWEALAHFGSWLWDVGTGTVQWSDECHRIHGVDPLDFDGTVQSHIDVVHPSDRERVRLALDEAVVAGTVFDEAYPVIRPGGEVREIRARAQPVNGSNGSVLGLQGIVKDVTDSM